MIGRVVQTLGALVCVATACSASSDDDGRPNQNVRSIQEQMISGTTNYIIANTVHETSAAFVPGSLTGLSTRGRWVVGYNTGSGTTTQAGWAFSPDTGGRTWTTNSIATGLDFGDPGASPVNGSAFAGWRGDPSIATITNPDPGFNGAGMIYTMVGASTKDSSSDVVMALSTNSGGSWSHAAYVNTATTGSAGNGAVDNPYIASNAVAPYGTYVVWQTGTKAWLRKVGYDPATRNPVFGGAPIGVPAGPEGNVFHPELAVGTFTPCGGTAHESVYVTFSTGSSGRCANAGAQIYTERWYLAVYDTVDRRWYGPWKTDEDSSYPLCVGAPNLPWIHNDPRARIAVHTTSPEFWIAHTRSSAAHLGTRATLDWGSVACVAGQPTPEFSHRTAPDPCVPPGCNVQDEYGAAVAFNTIPGAGTARAVVTFYSNRADRGNKLSGMYMMYSENNASFTNPSIVSVATGTDAVPWDDTKGAWDDYQTLAPNPLIGSFFGAWGGDARRFASSGTTAIWSVVLN